MNGGRGAGSASVPRNAKAHTITVKPVLDPVGSAALRDQLLTDVDRLSSADAAATWAHRMQAARARHYWAITGNAVTPSPR